jgi:single-strand DNA-binding protein
MSKSMNRVTLIGNVGSDPEARDTGSGTRVAHVSLATNRVFNRNGESEERTDWHRLTFWGRSAEIAEDYVRKGNRLFVEGRIEYGSYERDGVSIPTVDVVVRDFVMLGSRDASSLRDTGPHEPAEA